LNYFPKISPTAQGVMGDRIYPVI